MKIKLCKICGEENSYESIFCESCGGKFIGDEEIINTPKIESIHEETVKVSDEVASESKYKKNKKPVVGKESALRLGTEKILIVSTLILLGSFLILMFGGTFNQPEPQKSFSQNQNFNQGQQNGPNLSNVDKIDELEKIVGDNPKDLNSLLELAHLLNDSGFHNRAIEKYKQYLITEPLNADVLVDMGVCYFELNDFNNALQSMSKAIEINPKHQIAYFNSGIVSYSAGKIDQAKTFWQKAIEINPNTDVARRAQDMIKTQ